MSKASSNDGDGSKNHEPPEDFSIRFSLKIPPAVWRILMASGGTAPVIIWLLSNHR